MATVRNLVAKFTADTSGFNTGVDSMKGRVASVDAAGASAFKGTSASLRGLGRDVSQVGRLIGGELGGALSGVFRAAGGLTSLATSFGPVGIAIAGVAGAVSLITSAYDNEVKALTKLNEERKRSIENLEREYAVRDLYTKAARAREERPGAPAAGALLEAQADVARIKNELSLMEAARARKIGSHDAPWYMDVATAGASAIIEARGRKEVAAAYDVELAAKQELLREAMYAANMAEEESHQEGRFQERRAGWEQERTRAAEKRSQAETKAYNEARAAEEKQQKDSALKHAEEAKSAEQDLKKANDEFNAWFDGIEARAKRVRSALRTPFDDLRDHILDLNELFAGGAITAEEYWASIENAKAGVAGGGKMGQFMVRATERVSLEGLNIGAPVDQAKEQTVKLQELIDETVKSNAWLTRIADSGGLAP